MEKMGENTVLWERIIESKRKGKKSNFQGGMMENSGFLDEKLKIVEKRRGKRRDLATFRFGNIV